ncbi:acetyltransferase [Candidatus Latescibacterota bacterium]
MRDLIIHGIGPHAREMADIVVPINAVAPTWRLLGFVDPQGTEARELDGHPVLGGAEALVDHPQASVLPEYGSGPVPVPDSRLATLVAPTAFVASSASLGPGCVLYPGCFVGAHAVLGRRVFCLANSVINHDDQIGDGVTLCAGAALAGHVLVEAGAYLGQGCTVRQDLRVGAGSVVGMGSVVTRDVPAGVVVAGCPARVLADRSPPAGANEI